MVRLCCWQARVFPCIALRTRASIRQVLDSKIVVYFFMLMTLYTLYIMDIRTLHMPPEYDRGIDWSLVAVTLTYCVEFMAASIARFHYAGSFFFWLDAVATISIAVAVPWSDAQAEQSCSGAGNTSLILTQTGRTVRLVRQGGRALRILRVIRVAQVARFFKILVQMLRGEPPEEVHHDEELTKEAEASALGEHLSSLAARRVVIIIVLLSLMMPFYSQQDANAQAQLAGVVTLSSALGPYDTADMPDAARGHVLSAMQLDQSYSVLHLVVGNQTWLNDMHVVGDSVRCTALSTADATGVQGTYIRATFDNSPELDAEALFNIAFVTLVLVLLMGSMLVFAKDTRKWVVIPILRVARVLRSVRDRMALTVLAMDKHRWETDFVENAVLEMAMWIEHQEHQNIRPPDRPRAGSDAATADHASPALSPKSAPRDTRSMGSLKLGAAASAPPVPRSRSGSITLSRVLSQSKRDLVSLWRLASQGPGAGLQEEDLGTEYQRSFRALGTQPQFEDDARSSAGCSSLRGNDGSTCAPSDAFNMSLVLDASGQGRLADVGIGSQLHVKHSAGSTIMVYDKFGRANRVQRDKLLEWYQARRAAAQARTGEVLSAEGTPLARQRSAGAFPSSSTAGGSRSMIVARRQSLADFISRGPGLVHASASPVAEAPEPPEEEETEPVPWLSGGRPESGVVRMSSADAYAVQQALSVGHPAELTDAGADESAAPSAAATRTLTRGSSMGSSDNTAGLPNTERSAVTEQDVALDMGHIEAPRSYTIADMPGGEPVGASSGAGAASDDSRSRRAGSHSRRQAKPRRRQSRMTRSSMLLSMAGPLAHSPGTEQPPPGTE